ncbi:MAG TPA: hypothetical protein DEB39_02500 [Planctomycetaceae bacterium]|nr:hypothetical protein [Planctomycetaceae bacterium]
MDEYIGIIIVVLFTGLAAVCRLIAGSLNHERIRKYVGESGGTVHRIEWTPFGPGWLGDRNPIYHVLYRDREGTEHDAYCKTSMWAGVYFTRDEIKRKAATKRSSTLEEENRRLREEIKRLERDKYR